MYDPKMEKSTFSQINQHKNIPNINEKSNFSIAESSLMLDTEQSIYFLDKAFKSKKKRENTLYKSIKSKASDTSQPNIKHKSNFGSTVDLSQFSEVGSCFRGKDFKSVFEAIVSRKLNKEKSPSGDFWIKS